MITASLSRAYKLRGPLAALALAVALYGFFALNTGRIPGTGGPGWDGGWYAQMAVTFDPLRWGQLPPVRDVLNRRFLPAAVAHYVSADPVQGFIVLNFVSLLVGVLAFYGIARIHFLPTPWALFAISLWLVVYPILRFWVYYPILTDAIGQALLLASIWAVIARRYFLYAIAGCLLLATRENGIVVTAFFAIFHLNPWNPWREKRWALIERVMRLAACNAPLIGVTVLISLFPPYPAADHYDQIGSIGLYARELLASQERQIRLAMAVLNVLGLIPYGLLIAAVSTRLSEIYVSLRANLHWLWYLALHLVLAPLAQPNDPERTLILLVPPLALAATCGFRQLRLGSITWVVMPIVVVAHAVLTQAFSPLWTIDDYMQLGTGFRTFASVEALLRRDASLALIAFIVVGVLRMTKRRSMATTSL